MTVYPNHRVLIQGQPLLLYNEFISYVSYSPKVEMNDIIQATNEFNCTNTDVDTARSKLSEMMPIAYSGNINDTIWKVFSPAMALLECEKNMEDYSCCVFPALRALEGYLKYLLDEKQIVIDAKHNFGTVFRKAQADSSRYTVIEAKANSIADSGYIKALEDIYNYFNKNRHVLFHTDQILINTKIIEDKQEAITTVTEVAALIEDTYKQLF